MATNVSEFKNLAATDVIPCPDPIIDRETISVILDFCKKSNVLQREFEIELDTDDIDTELQDALDIDITDYAQNLRLVALLDLMVDSNGYVPFKRDIQSTITNFTYIKDTDYKYFWLPDDRTIRLFDMDTTDQKVWIKASFKPLRTATKVDDFLFEDWSEAIVAGVKWKILSMPNKEWSDKVTGEFYRREYRKYLSQAKQATIKGGSGQPEQVNWKSFGELD